MFVGLATTTLTKPAESPVAFRYVPLCNVGVDGKSGIEKAPAVSLDNEYSENLKSSPIVLITSPSSTCAEPLSY